MNQTSPDVFLKNIFFLSSLAQYNGERRQLILKFYDVALRRGTLFSKSITLKDVQRFCHKNLKLRKDPNIAREMMIQDNILTLLGSVSLSRNFRYITTRYAHLDDAFLKKYGFHIASLPMMESILQGIIFMKAESLEISQKVYEFRTKSEYAHPCFLVEPDITFQNKWNACIITSSKELLNAYTENWVRFSERARIIASVQWKLESPEELEKLIHIEAISILKRLSIDLELGQREISHPFLKPLVKILSKDNHETHYIVPFPYVLGSSTNSRLENYIQSSKTISKIEERSKGEIVEFLAKQILVLYPNKNVLKNFRYRINKKTYESDAVVILDKSLWIVEVKSHPIFKKIPLQINRILPIFVEKTKEGLEQGKRTLDFLKTQKETLFQLGCTKSYGKLIKGVIVVFDGFIPTLLTQNEKFDRFLGTHSVYEGMTKKTRIYVATLLDLYFLFSQPDLRNFEDFLIWRTKYLGKFPIISYDETEYWAFFNDRYIKYPPIREAFPDLVKRRNTISYISARFNVKDYLKKLVKQDNHNKETHAGKSTGDSSSMSL